MSIEVWFAYTLPLQDQFLNKTLVSTWSSFEQMCCRSLRNCQRNGNERTDRRRGWLTDRLTALCRASFLLCWVMACCRSDTTFSADSQWVSHTLSNPGPSYPNSAGEQGEEIEFPPSKTGLQIPINRSLESLQSIKFHLPRWSGQSGSSVNIHRACMHEYTCKHVRMHAEELTTAHMHALQRSHKPTCTNRWIRTQSNKCNQTHTESYPSSQRPP